MTETLKIRGFGKQGINSDLPIYDLPPETLSRGRNFRCDDTSVIAFGGSAPFDTAPPLPPELTNPWHVHFVDGAPDQWVILGSDGAQSLETSSWLWNDITGPAFSVQPWEWTSTNLGRVPVFNNRGTFPMALVPGTSALQTLDWSPGVTWADRDIKARSVRSYKSFLIAMNIVDVTSPQPDVVLWSDSADTGALPGSWDYADPSTLAGKNVLGGNEGDIIDGLPLRDSFVVYQQRGITVMDFADGTDWVFRFRTITNSLDVININCIAEVKGLHFIQTADDIVMNDGNRIDSILHNRMRTHYQSHINSEMLNRCFVARDDDSKEVWFCYPEVGADRATQAMLWNWRDQTWAVRDLPSVTHMDYGYAPPKGQTWVDDDRPWGEETETWGSGGTSSTGRKNLGVSGGGLVQFDYATEDYQTLWERQSIPIAGLGINVTIQRLLPQIRSENSLRAIYIEVGSQQFAEDRIEWKPAIRFRPGIDRKIDMRTTGELFSFRVRSTGIGIFEMSGIDVEFVLAGRR